MPFPLRLCLAAAACCLVSGGPLSAQSAEPAPAVCEQAGLIAEQTFGLPPGLLLAIGRVESGRWDPARQRVTPWPWAVNAAGKGLWFESPDEAVRTVRALRDAGTQSIDTGCFQISLLYHPDAFASLEQAFAPSANAAYAARFLVSLYLRLEYWDAAVAAYHSADPALGMAYRQQVFAAWNAAPPLQPMPEREIAAAVMVAPRPVAIPEVIAGVAVWTPMQAGTAPNAVAIPVSADQPRVIPVQASQLAGPLPTVIPHRFMPGQ